jgi:hypothetical protein
MAHHDSLGNAYDRLPKAPPIHKAKPSTETSKRRSTKHRGTTGVTKHDSPYHRYRMRVGRPLGRGVPGNKSGRHRVARGS